VLVIEAELVWQLIDESNVLARNLLRLLSFRIRAANAQLRRRQKLGEFYRQLSMIDGLTDLYNRAWLNDLLPTMVATAHGSNAPLSLIMIDLDHFKRFNDSHGHLAGDEALRTAARAERRAAPDRFRGALRRRGNDGAAARHQRQGGVSVAERLCERMRRPRCSATCACRCRTSRPRSAWPACSRSRTSELIAHADAALYRAKEKAATAAPRQAAQRNAPAGTRLAGARPAQLGWWAAMKSA
jgi:diguanylate cyclase (GGDEF)-like protein